MARKGRPRKQNAKRHPNGRLVHEASFDKGSEWVQSQRDKYQTHYNTALGRAYASGLLHDDAGVALDLYQAGKRFARVYNRVIGGETYRCPLDRTPRGAMGETEGHEQEVREHDWLFAVMASLDTGGLRPWLDQLITRAHTDHGPPWLDRLLAGGKDPADRMVLKAAVQALGILAPNPVPSRILVQVYHDAA